MNNFLLKTKTLKYELLSAAMLIVPAAFSQTLTITQGNGQLIASSGIAIQNLTVRLLDATGAPQSNQFVTFTSSNLFAGKPFGTTNDAFGNTLAITDANGYASVSYIAQALIGGAPYASNTVIATIGTLQAVFYETTVGQLPSGGGLVTATIVSPPQGSGIPITGAAGSVSTTPIQVRVQANTNVGATSPGVPNVGLSIAVDTGSTGSLSCKEGAVVLTDFTGTATCTPLLGTVGSGTYTVNIGNFTNFPSQPFEITVGPPALIQITSGNNQAGSPGTTLPLPLVAVITDLGGNPVSGVNVAFTSVTPGGATFTSVRSSSDSNGRVSANVVLGNVPGVIQISLADTGGLIKSPAIFTETVNLTITGIQKSAGDQQTAIVNSSFANPLVVQVNAANGQSAQGTTVQFAVTSGSGSLSSSSSIVNSQGQASTTVTAGSAAGPLVVTASTGAYSVAFNLTVAPPGPSNLTFTNNASGVTNSLSPGSVATIYGSGIASAIQGVVGTTTVGPLPYNVAGVTVKFGAFSAPIFGIGNTNGTQFVTVQVPFEVPFGATPVTVSTGNGAGSTTVQANIGAASPGLFEYVAADNSKNVVALRPDGSVVGPSNPAARGESIRFYVTGLGPMSPSVATNCFSPAASDAGASYPIVLGISNNGTDFTKAIYARNLIGVEEITFTLPSSTATGRVGISIGVVAPTGVAYSQGSSLYVQ